jgi:SAM-dependent methyltransferase
VWPPRSEHDLRHRCRQRCSQSKPRRALASADVDTRLAETQTAYDANPSGYQQFWRGHRPLDAIRKFGTRAGRGARVLDVAAGPGVDLRLLRDAGLRVYAGDLSHPSMKVAVTLFPKGALAQWDFRRLPFPDAVFDGVWASAALQHVPRAQIRRVLAEWRRVQRGGPIFVSMREGTGDLELFEDPPAGKVHATTVTGDELRALLLDAGYTGVEVEPRPDLLGRSDVTWLHAFGTLSPSADRSETQLASRSAR